MDSIATSKSSATWTTTPTETGYYCVKVTDSAGHFAYSQTVEVTVEPQLQAYISVSPTSIYSGGSSTLTASASGGSVNVPPPPYKYQFYSGSSPTCADDSPISTAFSTTPTLTVSPSSSTYYCVQVTQEVIDTSTYAESASVFSPTVEVTVTPLTYITPTPIYTSGYIYYVGGVIGASFTQWQNNYNEYTGQVGPIPYWPLALVQWSGGYPDSAVSYTAMLESNNNFYQYSNPYATGGLQSWYPTAGYPVTYGGNNGNTADGAADYGALGYVHPRNYQSIPYEGIGCTTVESYAICVGGRWTTNLNIPPLQNVYYVPLTASGLGSWQSGGTYPINVVRPSCVTTPPQSSTSGIGYIYCIGGGDNSGSNTNLAYFAPIYFNSDNYITAIGSWSQTNPYPLASGPASCVSAMPYGQTNYFIYCVGQGKGSSTATYYAQLTPDGLLPWVSGESLPSALGPYSQCSVAGSNPPIMYCLGNGQNPNPFYYSALYASNNYFGGWLESGGMYFNDQSASEGTACTAVMGSDNLGKFICVGLDMIDSGGAAHIFPYVFSSAISNAENGASFSATSIGQDTSLINFPDPVMYGDLISSEHPIGSQLIASISTSLGPSNTHYMPIGSPETLTATPMGGVGPYTYQWYEAYGAITNYYPLPGATSSSYTTSATWNGCNVYILVVKDTGNSQYPQQTFASQVEYVCGT